MSDTFCIVLNTCPSFDVAQDLARRLVSEECAACVSIVPGIQSVYRWNDHIETNAEWLLMIKTRTDHYPRVQETLTTHHPYELPEVIAVPIDAGLPAYLSWIDANVRPSA